jgi:hypothetical protein
VGLAKLRPVLLNCQIAKRVAVARIEEVVALL